MPRNRPKNRWNRILSIPLISSSSENVWNEWSDDDGTPSNESGVLDETLHERHCSGESEALFCFLIVDAVPAGLYSVSDLHGSEHCIPGYSSRFPSDVSTLCTFNFGFSLCYKQVPYCTDLYKSSSSPWISLQPLSERRMLLVPFFFA